MLPTGTNCSASAASMLSRRAPTIGSPHHTDTSEHAERMPNTRPVTAPASTSVSPINASVTAVHMRWLLARAAVILKRPPRALAGDSQPGRTPLRNSMSACVPGGSWASATVLFQKHQNCCTVSNEPSWVNTALFQPREVSSCL